MGNRDFETFSFLTIAANAPFQSLKLGFDNYESFSKHFLKSFEKSRWFFIKNKKEIKKANELLASFRRGVSNDQRITVRIENMLSDVKSAIEEDVKSGEKLIEHYQDLGQTVGASGPSQVEQDKKAERKADKAALTEIGWNNEAIATWSNSRKSQKYHEFQNQRAM
ncbi:hypothetical protein [Candidatus Williamhamiltonella defendens]|uniref:Uncharacterized protein n=1 Tax=Candidatus Williamhamiltonella defendens TaxID=138072 RepID=A0A2D3TCS9_9ENTR|nr:hypothetical protein [Candidatus Hamiltonella defensa]ATW33602.1 hypothetical protein BJP43_04135 [Candidatus Hamiltonella defensa]